MKEDRTIEFLFFMLTFFLLGLFLFLFGFFPFAYKDKNESAGEFKQPSSIGEYSLQLPSQKYTRIFLMIVDAFRYDFFNNANMPYASKNACAKLQIKVEIPTVTMPRIKSLIAGTLSSFADIVLNLGSTDQLEDSLLHRIRMNGDVAIFAGDKTWVDLFPTIFQRHQANLDSFFVNDFYEGDRNVTKTIIRELQATDWNIFITHYLGLDHIGHVEGSSSPKISIKLKEMDKVIEQIQNDSNITNDILLVTGDHGMRNGGGHGGSTKEELFVPLITFQPKCVSKRSSTTEFKQIDLAPTLAILMSSNIPRQSIGSILPDLITHMSLEDQLYAYYYNALHLFRKANSSFNNEEVVKLDCYNWFNSAIQMHIDFLRSKRNDDTISSFSFEKSKLDYIRASRGISNKLAASLVFFKYDFIVVGIVLSTLVTINTLIFVLFEDAKKHFNPSVKQFLITTGYSTLITILCKFMDYIEDSTIMSWLIILPISAAIYIFVDISKVLLRVLLPYQHLRYVLPLPIPLCVCFVFHSCSLASSSFIEEEHQTWYYLGGTILIGLFLSCFKKNLPKSNISERNLEKDLLQDIWHLRYSLAMLAIVALARKLNQTGDKWKHLQDFGDLLNIHENIFWLSGFFLLGLIMLVYIIRCFTTPLQFVAAIAAATFIYFYRGTNKVVLFFDNDNINSTFILICFWTCISFIALNRYKYIFSEKLNTSYESHSKVVDLLKTNLTCSLLISALLHKPHNVILLFAMLLCLQEAFRLCDILQLKNKWKFGKSYMLIYKTALTIIISKMFYFYQGNSNSLATIDLNPGYIGQNSYNPIHVASFVTLNTFSAQINAFLYLLMHMLMSYYDSLLQLQKKDMYINTSDIQTTDEDLKTVISLFAVATLLPTTLYMLLLILFRYHLFIYSVFAPKALYECFNIIVFYLNFSITNLYFMVVK